MPGGRTRAPLLRVVVAGRRWAMQRFVHQRDILPFMSGIVANGKWRWPFPPRPRIVLAPGVVGVTADDVSGAIDETDFCVFCGAPTSGCARRLRCEKHLGECLDPDCHRTRRGMCARVGAETFLFDTQGSRCHGIPPALRIAQDRGGYGWWLDAGGTALFCRCCLEGCSGDRPGDKPFSLKLLLDQDKRRGERRTFTYRYRYHGSSGRWAFGMTYAPETRVGQHRALYGAHGALARRLRLADADCDQPNAVHMYRAASDADGADRLGLAFCVPVAKVFSGFRYSLTMRGIGDATLLSVESPRWGSDVRGSGALPVFWSWRLTRMDGLFRSFPGHEVVTLSSSGGRIMWASGMFSIGARSGRVDLRMQIAPCVANRFV